VPNPQPAKFAASKAYNAFNLASFTVGTKTSNTINVAVQLKDARGQKSGICVARCFLSDASTGLGITGTPCTSNIAIGTNGYILDTPVTEKEVIVESNATGAFDLNLIQTAGGTNYWLVLVLPDGSILVSPEISF
jgi:hypothetical protein